MIEPIHFDTDLFRRDALESAAQKFHRKARIELDDAGSRVVAHLQPLANDDEQELRDDFCTEAFSATARQLRDLRNDPEPAADDGPHEPPWSLLQPYTEGSEIADGWALDSLSPIRSGAATILLRHPTDGTARVSIRRHDGTPLGVAHTDNLDFLLMNGGSGSAPSEGSVVHALTALTTTLGQRGPADAALVTRLQPATASPAPGRAAASQSPRRIGPARIDSDQGVIAFDVTATGIPNRALYDAALAFADRCYIFLERVGDDRLVLRLKARTATAADTLASLAEDISRALARVVQASAGTAATPSDARSGLPRLAPSTVDMEGLLAELEAADPKLLGLGFQSQRGPAHAGLGVLNILGTGACNSDCVFCCEKFHPSNRVTPNADATRQLILNSSGRFDMLFFASGEPTIHPKLFEYVELAKRVGYKAFGMSSHFRTFADPRFALETLQAGFQFFDISLHAADATSQLEVNPIGDDGASLYEALKGVAVLYRLAEALAIRITITQKIVVSKLNVTRLEETIRVTYDRGVRHFILQPVRTVGLPPERQAMLTLSEEEMLPHLNELIRKCADMGVVIKPYGFSRQGLLTGEHVESEQNRLKNISGKTRRPRGDLTFPPTREARPDDGRFWIELRAGADDRFGYPADSTSIVLDGAIQRGALVSFGCRMGSCGMCCAQLVDGRVDQSAQLFLNDEQLRQGYVLLCQARPLSDVTFRLCTDDEIDAL